MKGTCTGPAGSWQAEHVWSLSLVCGTAPSTRNGQPVEGTGVTTNTTNTGGSGTSWTVTPSQTAASTTMTAFDPWIFDWVGTMLLPHVGSTTGNETFKGSQISSNRYQCDVTG